MATITLKDVSKAFTKKKGVFSGGEEVTFSMENINLTFPDGMITSLIGPSGSGKTTLLKLIAGIERPDSGQVLFDGEDMTGEEPESKNIGMVFEDYALYPHFDVEDNILSRFIFSRRTRNEADGLQDVREEKLKNISQSLEFDLKYLRERMPDTLSAGEKQRVALGRCIAFNPELFLLDEPFSGFDPHLREKFRLRLHELLQKYSITTICVVHDQKEARLLSDRTVIMRAGKIVQSGDFEEVYQQPADVFVAEFLSKHQEMKGINLLPGVLLDPVYEGRIIGFRPDEVNLLKEGVDKSLVCEVSFSRRLPGRDEIQLEVEEKKEKFELSLLVSEDWGEFQAMDTVRIKPDNILIFSSESEKLLDSRSIE